MKRMPTEFYRELNELRSKYGDVEYDRDDILPATIDPMEKHGFSPDGVKRDAANAILDRAERDEDAAAQGLFPFDTQIALGERKRIKRGCMNTDQLSRRKRVIDNNKAAQDRAWASETGWLNVAIDKLTGRPPETIISDVMEDETVTSATAA